MKLKGLNAVKQYRQEVKEKNFNEWGKRHGLGPISPVENPYEYGIGSNIVSDCDEDYLYDALFDVPNRY